MTAHRVERGSIAKARPGPSGPLPGCPRGFSLVEVMAAMALLAFIMVGVASNSGDSIARSVQVMDLTTAVQLIETVVMDVEEQYRLEGFQKTAGQIEKEKEKCEVPRGFEQFRCEYDLYKIDIDGDNVSARGDEANENVNASPLMKAFCAGGPEGGQAVDPATAVANLTAQGQSLPTALAALQALLDPGFTQICGINIERMCQNTQMITSFIPDMIKQAAASTRKLVVRISWEDDRTPDHTLQIETYITAVPEAEEQKP